jgi:hypothetical protein
MTSQYVIGYSRNGTVELGWFFETLSAARRWAERFVRGFDSIVIYDATGRIVETVRP